MQFATWAVWYFDSGKPPSVQSIAISQWLLAAALATFGQALNLGIYRAIGKIGALSCILHWYLMDC